MPLPLSPIHETAKKELRNQSTTLINSLLHDCAEYESLTPDEKITAGLLSVAKAPIKIVTGALMLFTGAMISPLPHLVLEVKTEEKYESENVTSRKISEITGVSIKTRPSGAPTFFERESTTTLQNGTINVEITSGTAYSINPRVIEPEGTVTARDAFQASHTTSKTTVTGYNLATTGLGQIISGAIDPLRGLASAGYFGFQKWKAKREARKPIELQEMSQQKHN